MEKSSDTIGNRTRDLPTCSAMPQPTAPPCAPFYLQTFILNCSFIVILSDHIFCTLFYENTTLCKTETCENGKKYGKDRVPF